jgi:hypothetical protein
MKTTANQIKKVKDTNFNKNEVEKLLESKVYENIKYGSFIMLLNSTATIARVTQEKDPENFEKSEAYKMLINSFEWENQTADILNIDQDELSEINIHLIDNYSEMIDKYEEVA